MIEASQLHKSFAGVPAVQGVSFRVPEGGRLMLLGTSGSGKTTTLRMLNRLIDPDGGQVLFRGKDTRSLRPEILRRQMGYVMQQYGLFPHYTVADNIAIVPRLLHWDKPRIRRRTEDLLHKLGLSWEAHAHQYPAQLSGGQQQRVAVARAIVGRPRLVVADEPTANLDSHTAEQLMDLMSELNSLHQITFVFSSHDPQVISRARRVISLQDGRIVADTSPEQVRGAH